MVVSGFSDVPGFVLAAEDTCGTYQADVRGRHAQRLHQGLGGDGWWIGGTWGLRRRLERSQTQTANMMTRRHTAQFESSIRDARL